MRMTRREAAALDRYITGNYGEDQFTDDRDCDGTAKRIFIGFEIVGPDGERAEEWQCTHCGDLYPIPQSGWNPDKDVIAEGTRLINAVLDFIGPRDEKTQGYLMTYLVESMGDDNGFRLNGLEGLKEILDSTVEELQRQLGEREL